MSFNHEEFVENKWRGPKPKSKADLQGYGMVLSLQSETVEAPYVWQEKKWCDELCIEFHHVPMSLVTPPTEAQLQEAYELLRQSVVPTLVHCAEGVDRTGLVVAYYEFMRNESLTFGKVMGEAIDRGFHLDRYCWWLPVIREHFT